MWCYNSYWLIIDTVIASKFVHKNMIGTYIRLYLTHVDLQINVHFNIKSLNVNLLWVFIFCLLTHGYFSYSCLWPVPIFFNLLLIKHVLSTHHLHWTYLSPHYFYFKYKWVHIRLTQGSLKRSKTRRVTEQSVTQTITQVLIKAAKAVVMVVREADSLSRYHTITFNA